MQTNTKNSEFLSTEVNRILENLTKYASKPLGFDKIYDDERVLKKREVEYASSLPLQIILYFNVFYSIVWIIGTSFLWPVLVYKSTESTNVWIILILFAFIMMVIFEIVRLYLGYVGNLSERVPELTGFWLLTLMVEVPLSIFLLTIVWIGLGEKSSLVIAYILPMQFALQLIHAIFVYMELIFGLFALKVLARYQISRFHYKQFEEKAESFNYEDTNYLTPNRDLNWIENLNKNSKYETNAFNLKNE